MEQSITASGTIIKETGEADKSNLTVQYLKDIGRTIKCMEMVEESAQMEKYMKESGITAK